MIYLILAIICSTSISLLLKHNHTRAGNNWSLFAGNYLMAAAISFGFLLTAQERTFSLGSFIFGSVLATIYVTGIYVFARAVGAAGAALATVSARLSIALPVCLSIIIYAESPALLQLIGFTLTIATIALFYFSMNTKGPGNVRISQAMWLIALLFVIGTVDFSLKVFNHTFPATDKPFFVFTIFFFSLIYTSVILLIKKEKLDIPSTRRGLLLGVPNMFSTFFLIAALKNLPGIIVYPMMNIGIILLTTVAAVIIWKEKLTMMNWLAIISGLAAILLLGIK